MMDLFNTFWGFLYFLFLINSPFNFHHPGRNLSVFISRPFHNLVEICENQEIGE